MELEMLSELYYLINVKLSILLTTSFWPEKNYPTISVPSFVKKWILDFLSNRLQRVNRGMTVFWSGAAYPLVYLRKQNLAHGSSFL